MEKLKFIFTVEGFTADIASLHNKISEAKAEYIDSNRKFLDGERVKITGGKKERYAFVSSAKVSYFNDIEYVLLKEKKDGTPSLVKDFKCSNEIIEKI